MRATEKDDTEGGMNFMLKATVVVAAFAATACGGSAAPPFDTLPTSNVTAFRLQNFEPPPPPAGAPAPAPGAAIPGLPPQITQWMSQGAAGLEQLIPPGLIPPGMLQGMGQPQAPVPPPQQTDQAPRFHGFRILGQTAVIDERLKEELADVLGDEDNFHNEHGNCLYAEMGLSWQAGPGTQPNDLLISFSCNQMQSKTFGWPHGATGMTPDSVKELSELVGKLWPPGA